MEKSAAPLCGKNGEELETVLAPLPAFRARQVFSWICRGVSSFEEMTDLPAALRKELGEKHRLYSTEIRETLEAPDGTIKLRIGLEDGAAVEAVLLEDGGGRKTACISTQAGCPVGCVFCKTGSLGFKRNLEPHEITGQFFHLLRTARAPISTIVVMGMGEPLFNLAALRAALDILGRPPAGGQSPFSRRRITLSTSGAGAGQMRGGPQAITCMAENGPRVELAFSLTTAREELRRRLMPGTAGINLEDIKKALVFYQKKTGRRITLEMVLLGGVNTSREDAEAALDFARGLYVMVNLIPWNRVPGLCFEGRPLTEPSEAEIKTFKAMLEQGGLKTTRRYRRGRAVSGACGQLGIVPD